MSASTWRDWSCTVRVALDERAHGEPDADLARAEALVMDLMAEVDRAASRFRADSDTERVNAAAGRLVPVAPLTLTLVEAALAAARRTDGAVDPTVGQHVRDAGYTEDIAVVRGQDRPVGSGARPAAWRGVRVDRALGRVGVAAGLRLDLGATAKAWTVDEAARRVHARLGAAVLVEIGGDLAVAGTPTQPWRIDVAEVAGRDPQRLDLGHGALATSSTLARSWTSARGAEHHVIDPATSRPAAGPLRSASVWAPSCLEANTLSTAALVWGERAEERLRALCAGGALAARLVDRAGRVTALGAWPQPATDERGRAA